MVLNGWLAAPLRPAYDWVGPEHNTRDIRALKYHLVSGGLAFLQRSVAEIAVLISNGSHGRTSDAGTVLNVTVHPSSPISALSDEIGLLGGAFLSRTAIPNGVLPSVRYYALALTDLAPPSPSFLEYWSQRIHRIANWARAIGSTSICMSPPRMAGGISCYSPGCVVPLSHGGGGSVAPFFQYGFLGSFRSVRNCYQRRRSGCLDSGSSDHRGGISPDLGNGRHVIPAGYMWIVFWIWSRNAVCQMVYGDYAAARALVGNFDSASPL